MNRLKQLLVAAAALVVGGLGVGVALKQAGEQAIPAWTCDEWKASIQDLKDTQKKRTFFLAVQDGTTVPKAHGDFLLGDCSAGICTIEPQGCNLGVIYGYTTGPLVAGWRVVRINAYPYLLRGWKAAAAESGIKWLGSLSDVIAECKKHFTGAQCVELLEADNHCWLIAQDGSNVTSACRYGYHVIGHGQQLGPDDSLPLCPYASVTGGLPCVVSTGAGSERTLAIQEYDENLDPVVEVEDP